MSEYVLTTDGEAWIWLLPLDEEKARALLRMAEPDPGVTVRLLSRPDPYTFWSEVDHRTGEVPQ